MGIQEDLICFEEDLKGLIIEYEKYFVGVEKREPLAQLADLERLSRKLLNTQINNTMLKFRFNSLLARFSTYKQQWNKINLLIENGKYSRDQYRMRLHGQAPAPARELPSPARGQGTDMEHLHRQYMEARRACKLPEREITVDSIRQIVEKQTPQILSRYKCRSVDFKVVIEDGAPKIKAVPRS